MSCIHADGGSPNYTCRKCAEDERAVPPAQTQKLKALTWRRHRGPKPDLEAEHLYWVIVYSSSDYSIFWSKLEHVLLRLDHVTKTFYTANFPCA